MGEKEGHYLTRGALSVTMWKEKIRKANAMKLEELKKMETEKAKTEPETEPKAKEE